MRASMVAAIVVGIVAPATAQPPPTTALRSTAKFSRRVVVERIGHGGLHQGDLQATLPEQAPLDAPTEHVVVEEHPTAVRIVIEGDDARLLWWVSPDDLMWTVRAPTRVHRDGDAGIWLLPGARLAIERAVAEPRFTLATEAFTLSGPVAADALTHSFVARRAPRDGRALVTAILDRPDGAPLVTAEPGLGVDVIGGDPTWALVEHRGRQVRIVGWARRDSLAPNDVGFGSIEAGSVYGISDTDRVTVAAGACMFDDAGAVVGVETQTRVRYAHDGGAGQWAVYVGTPWGLQLVTVRDRKRGRGQPRWERCP